MAASYFSEIEPVRYGGPETNNPLAYRWYDPKRVVLGKTMEEHLRIAVCYWHTFCSNGSDIFGGGTFDRPWHKGSDPVAMAEQKLKMETIDVTLPGKPVREGHRHPLNLVLDEIKEIFLGIKEASPIRENPTYPYGDYFVKYGGEDLDAFTERVYGAVKGIAEHAAGECILIVSHGMAIRRFLTKFPEKAGEITGFIGNCGILEMTYADGKLTVEKIINPNG